MKKLVIVFITLIAFNAQAQGEYSHKNRNLTPDQMATLRAKQLTLDLDLNAAQQTAVFELSKKMAVEMKELKGKREKGKELSDDERFELKNKMLDKQIEIQNEMKTILDEEQFEQWKEIHKKRMKNKKKHRGEKRNQKG